jgi:cell division protein FtsA
MEEALSILANSLERSELVDQLGAGIVLTGGMTRIEGTRELAQALMPNIPVRIGKPEHVTTLSDDLNSSEFSTAIGLIYHETGQHTEYELEGNKNMLHSKDYQAKESLQDITMNNNMSKPKISVSTPSFNDEKENNNDLFKDLSQEHKKDQNNPLHNFMQWASKIF